MQQFLGMKFINQDAVIQITQTYFIYHIIKDIQLVNKAKKLTNITMHSSYILHRDENEKNHNRSLWEY